MGVIAKVQQPTQWFAGMAVVLKRNERVQICINFTKINQSVKRERHPLPAADQVLEQSAGAKVFSKLDANSGFWQIPLDPASLGLPDNVHHTLWPLLFSSFSLWHFISTRTFLATDGRVSKGTLWCGVHDGQYPCPWQDKLAAWWMATTGCTVMTEWVRNDSELQQVWVCSRVVKLLGHVLTAQESDLTPKKSQPSKGFQPLPVLERSAAF